MKKIIFLMLCLLIVTGCNANKTNLENNNNTNANNNVSKLDHKVYKYMRISTDNTSGLINNGYIFGDPSGVGHLDKTYNPTLLVEFDTVTGKASKVTLYAFFLDNPDTTEWVDKAEESFNEKAGSYKKDFGAIQKGRVNDFVTYLKVDINPASYIYNQYLETYLFYEQDIEKYKDEIYYSRLYNYSTTPEVKVGDNYFEESLEHIKIEWSDNSFSAF